VSRDLQAVFFDVDGVLIDSLPQHLQICRNKAVEFGLDLAIPTAEKFRRMVAGGTKVSPMRDFFHVVGFAEEYLDRAVADYEREFMDRYQPRTFEGVHRMLSEVHDAGVTLGIVTSNTRKNVVPALADSMRLFDDSCLFFYDAVPLPKWECLVEGARILRADGSRCVFVGDQPADVEAAAKAGWQFLGVTYGWGIIKGDLQFDTVDTVGEIPSKLKEMGTEAH